MPPDSKAGAASAEEAARHINGIGMQHKSSSHGFVIVRMRKDLMHQGLSGSLLQAPPQAVAPEEPAASVPGPTAAKEAAATPSPAPAAAAAEKIAEPAPKPRRRRWGADASIGATSALKQNGKLPNAPATPLRPPAQQAMSRSAAPGADAPGMHLSCMNAMPSTIQTASQIPLVTHATNHYPVWQHPHKQDSTPVLLALLIYTLF